MDKPMFVECVMDSGEGILLNVRDISSVVQSKTKGCFVSVLEEESYHLKNSFTDVISLMVTAGATVK